MSIALLTFSVTPNLSANTIFFFFGLGFTSTSATSSAATVFASVTSTVNSSPKTLLEASIALAGKNLFINAANGTPDSGLYSPIKSNIPRSPVSISSVNNCLSKPGASLRLSTILFTIGLNSFIISKTPPTPCSSYIRCTLSEDSLDI